MNNCKPLGEAAKKMIPDYFSEIPWGNIWNRKLESGTAFEWAVTAAVIRSAEDLGFSVSIPLLTEYHAPDFFVLRNEIPLAHGAQAGNSDTLLRSKPLNERFLYCMVPKAVLEKDNHCFSLFREGCPYHKIMSGKAYLERTDILLVPGKPCSGYPRLSQPGNEILFQYNYENQVIGGSLTAKSSPYIPVKRREPKGGIQILASDIIECSVNKTAEVASEQLSRYKSIFHAEGQLPHFSLVTGNDLSAMPYDTHTINLNVDDPDQIADELLRASSVIVQKSLL